MSGHLFVAQADLTQLACDAWLLPTDRRWHVLRGWTATCELVRDMRARDFSDYDRPSDWGEGARAVAPRRGDHSVTTTGVPDDLTWRQSGTGPGHMVHRE